jgi:hypothetical protein
MPEAPSASEAVTPTTETSQVSAATESQDVNSNPSPSSGGDVGDKGPSSLLDAVMRGVQSDKAKTEVSPNSETGKVSPDEDNTPLPDEVTTEELSRYHSRTRRRIQQLLDRNKATATELGQLKPLAEQASRINQFVQASGLDFSEVNSGFELMALMKTDPFAAREKLAPIWSALNKVCGVELPADLQQKVDQGFVDEATARDLAQSKARAHLAQNAQTRTVQTIHKQREQAEHRQFSTSVQSTIKTFEDNWRKSDPDFAVKQSRVTEKVELALSRMASKGETLKSPADAVKIIEDARKAVEVELKPFIQKREAINPLPGGGVTANGSPKAKSMAEAVAQGLRA